MYAIVVTGGKQYKVQEGDILFVEKIDVAAEESITFDTVLAVGDDSGFKMGSPTVDGAQITAKVIKQGKDKKIIVFKYKPKKGYRNKKGHRQPYTKIQIETIKA